MKRIPRSRKVVNLSQPLHKKVDLYTLAASAAGVGVLALAYPAEAKIVYTATNLQIHVPNTYPIDLNNDGKPDMQFRLSTTATSASYFAAAAVYLSRASTFLATSNRVAAVQLIKGGRVPAFAFPAGQEIGPARNFEKAGFIGGEDDNIKSHQITWDGQWANGGKGLNNRYAGVKFMINSEVHYGWIRISMDSTNAYPPFNVTVTGYAYETIPNKPIIAGATKGSDEEEPSPSAAVETPAPEPAMLGALALGAPGLSIWRRND
jgi:hypothetical protein